MGSPEKENLKVAPDNVRKGMEELLSRKAEPVLRVKIRKISEEPKTVGNPEKQKGKPEKENVKVVHNNVRKIREGLLLSKAELGRRARISVLTIDRVEKGLACRMDTKRKIILSLGLKLSDRDKVFTKG